MIETTHLLFIVGRLCFVNTQKNFNDDIKASIWITWWVSRTTNFSIIDSPRKCFVKSRFFFFFEIKIFQAKFERFRFQLWRNIIIQKHSRGSIFLFLNRTKHFYCISNYIQYIRSFFTRSRKQAYSRKRGSIPRYSCHDPGWHPNHFVTVRESFNRKF